MSKYDFSQVPDLLLQGKSNQEIALLLNIPRGSVYAFARRHANVPLRTPIKTQINNEFARGEHNIKLLAEKYNRSEITIYKYRKQYLEDRGIDDSYFMTLEEVAEELLVTPSYVSRTEKAALEKMKKYIQDNNLEETLMDIFSLIPEGYYE